MQGVVNRKPLGFLLIRAICWEIWAERNKHIFSFESLDEFTIIAKIDHLLIVWFFAAPNALRTQLEDSLSTIQRGLAFVKSRGPEHPEPPAPTSKTNPLSVVGDDVI